MNIDPLSPSPLRATKTQKRNRRQRDRIKRLREENLRLLAHSQSLEGSMPATASSIAASFTPHEDQRLGQLKTTVSHLNEQLRELHAAGAVVLVADDRLCKTGEHPCPQVRVDVRSPEDAVSRSESVDD